MNRVRELVGVPEVYRMGYNGEGIGVAVLDSGMDPQHPDLKGKMVYNYNYIGRNQNGSDDCGHGTHICGIIGGTGTASDGRYQGIAPGCHFVALKVLDRMGNGNSKAVEIKNSILQCIAFKEQKINQKIKEQLVLED